MAVALGVDIGGTKGAVTLFEADNWRIAKRWEFPAPPTFQAYFGLIKQAIAELGAAEPIAVGIACGGPLDSKRGLVRKPPHLPDWDDVPIAQLLSEYCGCPAFLQNDANAGALAEWLWGAGRGCDDVVFITFGTGFGAGIISGGHLVEGRTGQAGEIGHVRLHDKGPVAYGKAGSVEAFCSGGGIEQLYGQPAKTLFDQARQGDAKALKAVRAVAQDVGRAAAVMIDLFNPERVILGGIYPRTLDLLEAPIGQAAREDSLPRNWEDVTVLPSALGDRIGDHACMAIVRRGLGR
jgi:glucokinase